MDPEGKVFQALLEEGETAADGRNASPQNIKKYYLNSSARFPKLSFLCHLYFLYITSKKVFIFFGVVVLYYDTTK